MWRRMHPCRRRTPLRYVIDAGSHRRQSLDNRSTGGSARTQGPEGDERGEVGKVGGTNQILSDLLARPIGNAASRVNGTLSGSSEP